MLSKLAIPEVLQLTQDPNPFGYLKQKLDLYLLEYSFGGTSWVVDSGCTNHMTGEKDMFTSFQPSHDQSGNIMFGDNVKGEVDGLGKIAILNDNSISNV